MTKTILTVALILGSASAVLASEFDPNLQNRYPGLTQSKVFEGRNVALTGSQNILVNTPAFDRASNPYAGGGF